MRSIQRNKGGVALLSGGLDSVVALFIGVKHKKVDLALTFDYGQRAFVREKKTAEFFSKKAKVKHLVIKLPFLKKLSSHTGLLNGILPEPASLEGDEAIRNAEAVWIPNRNALFINIAASFCDAFGKKWIITGFNSEEGETFPDNSNEFVERINKTLEFSTLIKPRVWAPLSHLTKTQILKKAIQMKIPIEKIWVCYRAKKKHCGKCESCLRLKRAMSEAKVLEKYTGMFEK